MKLKNLILTYLEFVSNYYGYLDSWLKSRMCKIIVTDIHLYVFFY